MIKCITQSCQSRTDKIYLLGLCNFTKLSNYYSVDFIFLCFGIMGFIVELWNYKRVTDEA